MVNAAGYFLQIYVMFEEIGTKDTAWFALALAALYIFLSRQTRGRAGNPEAARTVDLLHLALAIGFITVAIPIRLDAHWVTMGWFVEAAVLLWVADRIHSELLNVFAVGALVLGVGRLLLIDNFYVTRPIFNTRMATYAVAIAVLGAVAWYGSRRKDETGRAAAAVSVVALNLLALIALSREVADYYSQEMSQPSSPGTMGPVRLVGLATRENRPRLHLLGPVDGLRRHADGGGLLAAFGIRALAGAGADRLHHRQSISVRRVGTGPRLPHREFHRARSAAAGDFVCLPARLAPIVHSNQFCGEFRRRPSRKSGGQMKSLFFSLGMAVALVAPCPEGPSISYFTNVREIRIAQAGLQNYFVVDEEIWNHARPDLADLRIYDGESQVQYALSEQRGGTSSHEVAAKILNLGSVGGRTEFDLDMSSENGADRGIRPHPPESRRQRFRGDCIDRRQQRTGREIRYAIAAGHCSMTSLARNWAPIPC